MSETSLVSRANFVATGAGTGYSIGDYIDHVVVVDISSGAVIAKFWENLTTEAKLASAPSPSNLGRMPVLINVDTITIAEPAGLATSAKQDAASASLASIDTKLPAAPATAANQATANTSLAAINTKLGAPLTVGGLHAVAAASFDRPADTTAYTIGDLIADSTTALSVTPLAISVARVNGGTGTIRRGRLTKSDVSTTLASFRAHLYKTAPTPANGDNGALSTDQALSYIGSMNFDMTGSSAHVFTDGVNCISTPNVGSDITFAADTGVQTIYALLEARAAYAPASGETFTLALEVLRD